MRFLSDEWFETFATAARRRRPPDDDPLAGVELTIEQVVRDGPSWRLVISDGALSVQHPPGEAPADIRLTSDRETAAAIASGRRAALDAFIAGELVIGGDVRHVLEHREALETLGDLFAEVRSSTDFTG